MSTAFISLVVCITWKIILDTYIHKSYQFLAWKILSSCLPWVLLKCDLENISRVQAVFVYSFPGEWITSMLLSTNLWGQIDAEHLTAITISNHAINIFIILIANQITDNTYIQQEIIIQLTIDTRGVILLILSTFTVWSQY